MPGCVGSQSRLLSQLVISLRPEFAGSPMNSSTSSSRKHVRVHGRLRGTLCDAGDLHSWACRMRNGGLADLATDMGLALGVTFKQDLAIIDAATQRCSPM